MKKSRLPKFNKVKLLFFIKRQLWQYLFIIGSIFTCCWLTNKWLEGIAFCFAHCVLRYKFDYQYHSPNHCLALTNFIIWACIPISLPMGHTLLFSIPIAFFICWLGNEEEHKLRLLAKYIQLKKQLTKTKFNVDTCTEQELIDRCKELHFSENNTLLAIEFFIKKTPHKILAEQLFIDTKSVTTRKKRLKAKLNEYS